jgi:hypothetical protein
MLFLMNNSVLQLDAMERTPTHIVDRFSALSLDFVSRLGAELFAEQPLLAEVSPHRAERLATLIKSKAPEINAALFVAPRKGARSDEVQVRYAEVTFEVMAVLVDRQRAGDLSTREADRLVWRRLAA